MKAGWKDAFLVQHAEGTTFFDVSYSCFFFEKHSFGIGDAYVCKHGVR